MYPKGDPYIRALVVARQLSLLGYRCQPKMEAISSAYPPDFVFQGRATSRKLYLFSQAVSVSISDTESDFSQLEIRLELFKTFQFITPGSRKPSTEALLRDQAQWILPIAWEDNRKGEAIFSDGKFKAVGLLVLTPGQKFQWIGMTTNSFRLALTGCLSQLGFQPIEPQDSDYLPLSPHVELSSLLKTDNLGSAEAEENFQVFLSNSHGPKGYLSQLREVDCAELCLSQSFGLLTFSDHPIVSDPASAAGSPDLFREGLAIVKFIRFSPKDTLKPLLSLGESCLLGTSSPLDAEMQGFIDALQNSRLDVEQFCQRSFLRVLRALLNNTQSTEDVPQPSASAASVVLQRGARRRLSDVFDRAAEAPVRFDAFFSEYTRRFHSLIKEHGDSSTFAAFVSRVVLEMIRQYVSESILRNIEQAFLAVITALESLTGMIQRCQKFRANINTLLKTCVEDTSDNVKILANLAAQLSILFQKTIATAQGTICSEAVRQITLSLDSTFSDWYACLSPEGLESRDRILFFFNKLSEFGLLFNLDIRNRFLQGCLDPVATHLIEEDVNCFSSSQGCASFVTEGPGELEANDVAAGQSKKEPSPAALLLRQPPPPPPRLSPAQSAAAAEFQSASPRATGPRAGGTLPPVRKSSFWRGFGRVILGGLGLTLIGIGVLAVLAVTHGAAVAPIAAAMPWLVNTVIHPMIAAMGVTGSVTVVSTISFSLGVPSLVEAASPSFFERCCGCFRPRRGEVRQGQASSAPASTSTGDMRSAFKSSPPGAVQLAGSPPAGAPSGRGRGADQLRQQLHLRFADNNEIQDKNLGLGNAP